METGNEDQQDSTKTYSVAYWLTQLDAAKEAQKEHNDLADEAWKEYLGCDKKGSILENKNAARYPIYYSSVRTIQPALYSRTPVPVIEKRFDDMSDEVARVAAIMQERLAKHLMRACPFDRTMYHTRDNYIHSGRATTRVFFDALVNENKSQKFYERREVEGQAGFFDDEGNLPEEDKELYQDDDGRVYAEMVEESLDEVKAESMPVFHRDLLHTPNARTWEELEWIGFHSMMIKADVEDRFGEEIAQAVSYGAHNDGDEDKEKKTKAGDKYLSVWEVWCKRTKTVYWVTECYKEDFLDTRDDPYELANFFPCAPFMLGIVGVDDLYAAPDYAQLRPLINQLHAAADRMRRLFKSIKKRGLADGSVPELAALMTESEGDFIMVNNFKELIGDGGLDRLVEFFPTDELVSAIQTMAQITEMFEAKFNEVLGIPDILRGNSDPKETAAAQQLKGDYASLRFSSTQREFQRLVRDTIEMMCDLALHKFPTEKLQEIMGFQYMPQQDQAVFPYALELLQNDNERMLRIDIETDSTITTNQNAEIEQRNYLAKVLFQGLEGLGKMSQQNPQLTPIVAQLVMYVIRGVRGGKQIEGALEPLLAQMTQQAMQPPPQQPDPAMAKAQMDGQMQQQKMQMEMQLAQGKMQLQQAELQIKAQQLQVQVQKIMSDSQNDQQKIALQGQIAELDAFLESSKIEMEREWLSRDMEERLMTEERLQVETALKVRDASKPEAYVR